MNRWFALIPLLVIGALAVLFAGWSLRNDPTYKPDAAVGRALPDRVLPVLDLTPVETATDARTVSLKAAGNGRPMIVNVFASWCAPCRAEHPRLLALKQAGITVIGVAYKDDPVLTRDFIAELDDPFSLILVDREGRAGLDLGISGVPESFAVDAQGNVVAKFSGPLLEQGEIDRLVAALDARPVG